MVCEVSKLLARVSSDLHDAVEQVDQKRECLNSFHELTQLLQSSHAGLQDARH